MTPGLLEIFSALQIAVEAKFLTHEDAARIAKYALKRAGLAL